MVKRNGKKCRSPSGKTESGEQLGVNRKETGVRWLDHIDPEPRSGLMFFAELPCQFLCLSKSLIIIRLIRDLWNDLHIAHNIRLVDDKN